MGSFLAHTIYLCQLKVSGKIDETFPSDNSPLCGMWYAVYTQHTVVYVHMCCGMQFK